MPYHLQGNYRRNHHPVDFDDHAPVFGQCEGWVWQPDVYPLAAELAREHGLTTIVDVGCGAARKLIPYTDEFTIIGLDRPEIVDQITTLGDWRPIDLNAPHTLPEVGPALWICSDVVEHLTHPEHVIRALSERLTDSVLVLSTPDRIRTRGARHRGPSQNRGHVQEWALHELEGWLRHEGIPVRSIGYTRSNDHEAAEATCLIVAGVKVLEAA